MAAKANKHLLGGLLLLAAFGTAIGPAKGDQPENELPAVDLATARVLLHSQVPKVPWLLRLTPMPIERLDLADLLPPLPAGSVPTLEANSEQRQPLQIGASLREQFLYGRSAAVPRLPISLRALAERQGQWVFEHLSEPPFKRANGRKKAGGQFGGRTLELELWPTQNEVGRLTWVISRYRLIKLPAPSASAGKAAPPKATSAANAAPSAKEEVVGPWQWLDASMQRDEVADDNLVHEPHAILPEHLSPASRRGYIAIFRDFLAADTRDLYEKPLFSQCVWVNADKTAVLSAWRPSTERPAQRSYFEHASESERKESVCIALPQPARMNQRPLALHLRITEPPPFSTPALNKVQFVEQVEWINPPTDRPLPPALKQAARTARLPVFPPSFEEDYRRDLALLTGTAPLPNGLLLSRKNSADPQNQLEALLDYLEERYKKLGLTTRRQRFTWRGIPQSNLIAVLPAGAAGARPGIAAEPPAPSGLKPPIVLADHIDTAFCEDIFARNYQRVSAKGADDNASATATLLRAAEVLRSMPAAKRQHEIWLLHLTGEEFPADDLGARQFTEELLRTRTDVAALLLLDMIGYNPRHRPEFQLNSGGYDEAGAGGTSLRLAQLSALLSPRVSSVLRPLVYPPTDLRSYLYNTDGVVFAEAGYPVVHFSEVMNRYQLTRTGYHDSMDTLQNFDSSYAAAIARVAIATASLLSELPLYAPGL